MKRNILKIFVYSAIYAMLAFTEKKTSVGGFGTALCAALIFCKENIAVSLVPYLLFSSLVHFDPAHALSCFCACAVILLYALICYKLNKKYRIWVNLILIAVTRIPDFFLYGTSTESLIYAAVSVPIALIYHYVAVAALYPITVRGVRYGLSEREKIFAVLFAVPQAAALALLQIKGIGLFFFAVVLFCLLLSPRGASAVLGFAVGAGAGASLVTLSPFYLCVSAAIGGAVCALKGVNKYVCGAGAAAAAILCFYIFGKFGWQQIAPPTAGALIALLPDKIFYRARSVDESYRGRFALRTLANRDREEVGSKLHGVASAFRRIRGIIEGDERTEPSTSEWAGRIVEACCADCGKLAACREKTGGAVKYVNKLFELGKERGKVNMLDVDGTLGAVCIRLPRLVNSVNLCVRELLAARERRTGIEQGRDMVMGNLSGTAELLDELAASISEGFDFDVEGEKRITEELACSNIIAGDAAIFGGGERITLSVRECDERKPELRKIVSGAAGRSMTLSERSAGVNGTVNLVFRPLPVYGVLYGEKSVSREKECGDARQAVRIAPDKLMFVLSDGMGTGLEAHRTGAGTISLIETFYRAGFGHKTIFGSVSKLLALRTKETFSALDVAIMDTQTGEIDFIKQGGRESYVFGENGVEVIEGGSLPMGIIEDGEPLIKRVRPGKNGLVIMISDGVADRINGDDMTEIVGALNTLNPQTIAEKIMENAVRKGDGREDDMTVMVIRLVQN